MQKVRYNIINKKICSNAAEYMTSTIYKKIANHCHYDPTFDIDLKNTLLNCNKTQEF